MASLSNRYVVKENGDEREGRSSLTALVYTFKLDLLPMLMLTQRKLDRLPIVYLNEAEA